jgi:iron complex transport system substrate-binding protein
MRAFAFLSAISLALAGCWAPSEPHAPAAGQRPMRVVSLNLCTDELLLSLADPAQIASVTHLSHREEETALAPAARAHTANDGTLASVVALRPDLVLTVGGAGDRAGIARRLGIPLVDLPYPQTLEDVERSIRTVAGALRREPTGTQAVARLSALRATAPAQAQAQDALWLGGGGRTVSPDGLEAAWMRLAGLRQIEDRGDRVELEHLITDPPPILLRSDYRAGQYSRDQQWLGHPIAARARAARTIVTEGRRWTCMGLPMIEEVERLRREVAQ